MPQDPHQDPNQPLPVHIPEKPGSFLSIVGREALVSSALVAAAMAVSTKIPFVRNYLQKGMKTHALEGAIVGAATGAVMGVTSHHYEHNEVYPAKLENAALREHVNELQNEKSFALKVAQEKMQAEEHGHGHSR